MKSAEIQTAVYQRLASLAPLQAIVGARVYDDVLQPTQFPYVVIGDDTSISWDDDVNNGAESTLTIHAWSRYCGRIEAKRILQAIYDGMHNYRLPITGAYTVLCQAEYQETFLDPDGITRHGVIRFRLITTH